MPEAEMPPTAKRKSPGSGTPTGPATPQSGRKRTPRRDSSFCGKDLGEVQQLRKLLHDANAAMVELAKEYKRLTAVVDSYKDNDNSLLCTSQINSQVDDFPSFSQADIADPAAGSQSQLDAFDLGQFSQMSDIQDTGGALGPLQHIFEWGEAYKSFKSNVALSPESRPSSSPTSLPQEAPTSLPVVRTGVGCLAVCDDHPGCVLAGRRKGSHGAGLLALPGGHLEVGEEWGECVAREMEEETGLTISEPQYVWVTNNAKMDEGKHYITIFMKAKIEQGAVPRLMEPEKCDGWEWIEWSALKKMDRGALFQPLASIVGSDYNPFP